MYPKPIGPKRPAGNPAFRQPKTDATPAAPSFNAGRNTDTPKRPAVSQAALDRDQMNQLEANSMANRATQAHFDSLAKVKQLAARADRLEAAGHSSMAKVVRDAARGEASKPIPVAKPRPGSAAALKGAPGGKGRTFDPMGGVTGSSFIPIPSVRKDEAYSPEIKLSAMKKEAALRDHRNYGGVRYAIQDKGMNYVTRFSTDSGGKGGVSQTPREGGRKFVLGIAAGGNRTGSQVARDAAAKQARQPYLNPAVFKSLSRKR
jgi:hypothetical protein